MPTWPPGREALFSRQCRGCGLPLHQVGEDGWGHVPGLCATVMDSCPDPFPARCDVCEELIKYGQEVGEFSEEGEWRFAHAECGLNKGWELA